MTKKIQKARAYHTAVSECDVATVRQLVHQDYIQHNPYVPTGREAFLALFPELKKHGTRIENHRIFQDGSYVVMHHFWKNAAPFGANEKIAFHIIRFGNDDLIAEHWSVMTDAAPRNPSGRTLIDGPTEAQNVEDNLENKEKVIELFRLLTKSSITNYTEIHSRFFLNNYHQHHPNIRDGIDGLDEAIRSGKLTMSYTRQHRIFGSDNFVLSISEGLDRKVPTAVYDLFRFQEGLIAEHWSISQEIPTEHLANENTMFQF